MLNKYLFFAVFDEAEESGYTITFPDLPGCITEASSISEGIEVARESLALYLYNMEEENESIPEATEPKNIQLEAGCFTVPIKVSLIPIKEEMNNKAVSKNVTLPYWLKKEAEKEKINFSATLQLAIKEKLGLIERDEEK